jgi:hypothetical protein
LNDPNRVASKKLKTVEDRGTPSSRSQKTFCRALRTCGAGLARPAPAVPQLFFPDGIAFDGNRLIGTGATAPAFSYLREIRIGNEGLVDQNSASWNHLAGWLHELDRLRTAG